MNPKFDRLEALLKNNNYEELRGEDKSWVDQQYTAVEYTALRQSIRNTSKVFRAQQTGPNPAIHGRLRQKIRAAKSQQPTAVTSLYNYRIPAWQAVAAIALMLFFIPQLRQQSAPEPEKIFIYQTDTVFKEVPAENMLQPILDTLADIPQVRNILQRTNRSPVQSRTVVFSPDSALGADFSQNVAAYFASHYDTTSARSVIDQYLKDSVKSYRVNIDTGFQDLGRIY